MLPIRKSSPVSRRNHAVAAEVRVPSLGTAFGALAASITPERVFLSTFQELEAGTRVVLELSLPDGGAVVDGTVVLAGDPAGQGIAVALEAVDDATRIRLSCAAGSIPPTSQVA